MVNEMDREQRAMVLFERAVELQGPERDVFLDRECAGDDELRRVVEALLEGEDSTVDVSRVVSKAVSPPPPPPVAEFREFSAGDVFADRYRIISLLGRGAMGEVYRAHDTVLDVPVAIKFVLGYRPDFRERLFKEVRLSREVTHPAVCRVFDVGSEGDRLYFTMEYVDGEDLASLVSRIGRLPSDKVVDIANQICGGLAAAHGKGVIHRDLKPANIMIDGEGRVRITDFGIAVTRDDDDRDAVAGTPAYMAPEQFNPDSVVGPTVDLYATGLILHELLTGRKVFDESGFTEIFRAKTRTRPAPPSESVDGVDPRLERVIMKAISRTPEDRPPSALAMAAGLPGGDPLAMAVEAGVLAHPEIVAAATIDRPFRRSSPWLMLVALAAALAGFLALAGPSAVLEGVRRFKAPEVLVDHSERLLSDLELGDASDKADWGFLDNVAAADPVDRVLFWYRQEGPRPLPDFVARAFDSGGLFGQFDRAEAIRREPLFVMLDPTGELVFLNAGTSFGSRVGGVVGEAGDFDWSRLLGPAGLQGVDLVSHPETVLPVASDERAAWTAKDPRWPDATIHVEAASFEGVPVYFAAETVDGGSNARHEQLRRRESLDRWVRSPLYLLIVLGALALGAHSIVHNRSDLRRAAVLAGVVLVVGLLAAVLSAGRPEHPLASSGITLLGHVLDICMGALAVGLCYVGLEPLIRRYRPQALIAWNRLLAGGVIDRSVGYGLLVGALAGTIWASAAELDRIVIAALGLDPTWGFLGADQLNAAVGLGSMLSTALGQVEGAIAGGLLSAVLFALLNRWLKPRWLARAVFAGLIALIFGIDNGAHLPLSIATLGLVSGVMALVLLYRFGLLTLVAALLATGLLIAFPMTTVGGVWFAQGGYLAIGLVLLLGVVGAVLAVLGGAVEKYADQPMG